MKYRFASAVLCSLLIGCGSDGDSSPAQPAPPEAIPGPRISGEVVIKALQRTVTSAGDDRAQGHRAGDPTIAEVGQFVEPPNFRFGIPPRYTSRSGSNGAGSLLSMNIGVRFEKTDSTVWTLWPAADLVVFMNDSLPLHVKSYQLKRPAPLSIDAGDLLHTAEPLARWHDESGRAGALVLVADENEAFFHLCWDTNVTDAKRRQCSTFTRAEGLFQGVYLMDSTTGEARTWISGRP